MLAEGSCSGRTTERRIRRSAGSVMRWSEETYTNRSIIGLGNETIIALSINLNNFRALGIEAGVDGESCKKSCNNSCGVDHVGGLL